MVHDCRHLRTTILCFWPLFSLAVLSVAAAPSSSSGGLDGEPRQLLTDAQGDAVVVQGAPAPSAGVAADIDIVSAWLERDRADSAVIEVRVASLTSTPTTGSRVVDVELVSANGRLRIVLETDPLVDLPSPGWQRQRTTACVGAPDSCKGVPGAVGYAGYGLDAYRIAFPAHLWLEAGLGQVEAVRVTASSPLGQDRGETEPSFVLQPRGGAVAEPRVSVTDASARALGLVLTPDGRTPVLTARVAPTPITLASSTTELALGARTEGVHAWLAPAPHDPEEKRTLFAFLAPDVPSGSLDLTTSDARPLLSLALVRAEDQVAPTQRFFLAFEPGGVGCPAGCGPLGVRYLQDLPSSTADPGGAFGLSAPSGLVWSGVYRQRAGAWSDAEPGDGIRLHASWELPVGTYRARAILSSISPVTTEAGAEQVSVIEVATGSHSFSSLGSPVAFTMDLQGRLNPLVEGSKLELALSVVADPPVHAVAGLARLTEGHLDIPYLNSPQPTRLAWEDAPRRVAILHAGDDADATILVTTGATVSRTERLHLGVNSFDLGLAQDQQRGPVRVELFMANRTVGVLSSAGLGNPEAPPSSPATPPGDRQQSELGAVALLLALAFLGATKRPGR